MEREPLFKARRKLNGRWVSGSLVQIGKDWCQIVPVGTEYDEIGSNMYRVISQTVCRFTGLTTKLGVNVFSGDKFLFKDEERYVEYIDDRCRYVLTNGKGYDSINCDDLDCDLIYGLEPIGNIYD